MSGWSLHTQCPQDKKPVILRDFPEKMGGEESLRSHRNHDGDEQKKDMMAAQSAPQVRKDHPAKKSSTKQNVKEGEPENLLYAVSEHSLSGFLEDESDMYSAADLKVRYW